MRDSDQVQIEIARTATDEVHALVRELEAVLAAEYPPEQRHGLDIAAIFQPHIVSSSPASAARRSAAAASRCLPTTPR